MSNKDIKNYIEYTETHGNIIQTCKECSDNKYNQFINNGGIAELMYAYEHSKSLFVKARFIDEEKVEHMWIDVLELIEEDNKFLIKGTLDNDPVLVSNVKCGDTVKISLDNICNFIADGKPFMNLI